MDNIYWTQEVAEAIEKGKLEQYYEAALWLRATALWRLKTLAVFKQMWAFAFFLSFATIFLLEGFLVCAHNKINLQVNIAIENNNFL